MTLLSLWQIQTGQIPVGIEQLADLKKASLTWSLGGLIPVLNIAAAVSLFLLRKVALYLFMAIVALGLINGLWQLLTSDWFENIGGQGCLGAIIGYSIATLICVYIFRLKQRGVLH
jgi:hypothetical protein